MADRAVMIALGTKLGSMSGANALQGTINRLAGYAKGIFAGVVAYKALGALKDAFDAVVESAQEQQAAIKSLEAAYTVAGFAAQGLTLGSVKLASELQAQTRYGDEAIIKMQALLVTYGVMPSKLAEATRATLDFAAATGTDLEAAAALVGKAAAGSTATLKRYGIMVNTEGLPASEAFAAVLAKMNAQFGGRAAADARTYAGQIAQLANVWDDLKEQVGDFVIESGGTVSIMETLKDAIRDAQGYLELYGPEIRSIINEALREGVGLLKEMVTIAKDFGEEGGFLSVLRLIDAWMHGLVAEVYAFKAGFNAVSTAISAVALGLGGMISYMIEGAKLAVKLDPLAAVTGTRDAQLRSLNAMQEDLKGFRDVFREGMNEDARATADAFEKAWGAAKKEGEALSSAWNADVDSKDMKARAIDDRKKRAAQEEAMIQKAKLDAMERERAKAQQITEEEAKRVKQLSEQYGLMSALQRAQVRAVLGKLQAGGQGAFEALGSKEMETIGKSGILKEFVERQGFTRRLAEKELGPGFAGQLLGKPQIQAAIKNEITAQLTLDHVSLATQLAEVVVPKIHEIINGTVGKLTGMLRASDASGQAVAGAASL